MGSAPGLFSISRGHNFIPHLKQLSLATNERYLLLKSTINFSFFLCLSLNFHFVSFSLSTIQFLSICFRFWIYFCLSLPNYFNLINFFYILFLYFNLINFFYLFIFIWLSLSNKLFQFVLIYLYISICFCFCFQFTYFFFQVDSLPALFYCFLLLTVNLFWLFLFFCVLRYFIFQLRLSISVLLSICILYT